MAKFQKGQSGNPAGRPKGIKDKRSRFGQMLEPHAPQLIRKAIAMAMNGNEAMLRLCIERLIPKPRMQDIPVELPGLTHTENLSQRGEVILKGLGRGAISAEQALKLLQGLGSLARIVEIDELEKRLAALEERT